MTQFNIEEAEFRILNYLIQSQATEKYCKHKHDTDIININIAELSKLAVKEHKDIHKLVVSKMFGIKYEAVTEEQCRIAKTVDMPYI